MASKFENQPLSSDLRFWVQFAVVWDRLAEMSSGANRSEYLAKAKTCIERADSIRAKHSQAAQPSVAPNSDDLTCE